jgi:hypothetical protein
MMHTAVSTPLATLDSKKGLETVSTPFSSDHDTVINMNHSTYPGPPQPAFIVPSSPVVHTSSAIARSTSNSPQPFDKAQPDIRATQATTQELLSALNTLRSFFFSTSLQNPLLPLPPQIIVKGNGKKRAYGRMGLKAMSYEVAYFP